MKLTFVPISSYKPFPSKYLLFGKMSLMHFKEINKQWITRIPLNVVATVRRWPRPPRDGRIDRRQNKWITRYSSLRLDKREGEKGREVISPRKVSALLLPPHDHQI